MLRFEVGCGLVVVLIVIATLLLPVFVAESHYA